MKKMLLAAAAAFGMAGGANAAVVYGVDEFNNLVTFNSAAPGVYTSTRAITGLDESIQALDFRPLNGTLYALGTDRIVYTVNIATGAATAVSGVLALTGSEFAFDFNPTIDRLRIVSNTNQNYVFNPNNGALTQATDVFFAAGDANAGANPDVVGVAYTTSTFGAPAGSTQLYAFDTGRNVLATQANSAGTLNTVGSAGFNLGSRVGFDILNNEAFAFNSNTLYSVNLGTGAFTQVGNTSSTLFAVAITAPVPEPATWGMMIAGFGLVGGTMRRRKRAGLPALA